jgi:hypothetical protein
MSREARMIEGAGERAERSRSNRFWWIMLGFMLLGAVSGATLVAMEKQGGVMPALLAIGLVLLLGIGVLAGAWWFLRDIDEVERRDNYIACTIALNFFMVLYAAWYFLWKGALVPEPQHETLFLTTILVMGVTYSWKKLRP